MTFKAFEWYCRPVKDGVWSKAVENAFGAYTPCATDSLVICLSYLVVLGLSLNRLWRLKKDFSVQRFKLRSNYYNYVLGLLAIFCMSEVLFRLVMGISAFIVDDQHVLPPYEMVSLMIEAVAWFSILVMLGLETKVYIRESRWSVRCGVIYALVGDAVMLNLVLNVKDFYHWSVLCLYISANAEYLRSLVLKREVDDKLEREKELDGRRRWLASSRWAAATQFALAVSLTSSQNDLVQLEIKEENSILKKTRDAVITLRGVLEGKHDREIEENLEQYEVSGHQWWSSLYKIIEGLAVMSRLGRNKLHQADNFEDRTIDWDHVEM